MHQATSPAKGGPGLATARGGPITLCWMSRTERADRKAGEEILRYAHPGCENEQRPGEAGAARQVNRGRADAVTAEPQLALTGFRWR